MRLERNWRQDKKVTERELKELGQGSDIYKDREGNLCERPKASHGPGEELVGPGRRGVRLARWRVWNDEWQNISVEMPKRGHVTARGRTKR